MYKNLLLTNNIYIYTTLNNSNEIQIFNFVIGK